MSQAASGRTAEEWLPPVAFYFNVEFHGESTVPDTAFREVSGLSVELDTEQVREGGENNFVYQLPTSFKHGRLVLKRTLEPLDNALEQWIRDNLENGFAKGWKPMHISVSLLDQDSKLKAQWLCSNAYPVKWEVSTLNAQQNELLIESLELNYNTLVRGK